MAFRHLRIGSINLPTVHPLAKAVVRMRHQLHGDNAIIYGFGQLTGMLVHLPQPALPLTNDVAQRKRRQVDGVQSGHILIHAYQSVDAAYVNASLRSVQYSPLHIGIGLHTVRFIQGNKFLPFGQPHIQAVFRPYPQTMPIIIQEGRNSFQLILHSWWSSS